MSKTQTDSKFLATTTDVERLFGGRDKTSAFYGFSRGEIALALAGERKLGRPVIIDGDSYRIVG